MIRIIFIVLSFLFSSLSYAAESACNNGFADLVEPLRKTVVNITTFKKASDVHARRPIIAEEFREFFERFGLTPPGEFEDFDEKSDNNDGEQQELRPYGIGSGFIIDEAGYIVTNHHLIEEVDSISVTLSNDKKFDAKLIGSDQKSDLALLKIETSEKLTPAKFGNSDESRVGDQIIAIGNPFGLGWTVTAGIISANARDINSAGVVDDFIQTDAAINVGNSGGPMFNMKGEVIGINTAIASPSGGNIGIGFAVPSSFARPIIDQIKKSGSVIRACIGIKFRPIEKLGASFGLGEDVGVIVHEVLPDSPAEKAGIIVGDVILKYNGHEIKNNKKLPKLVAETPVGTTVEVQLLSKGKNKTVKMQLKECEPVNLASNIKDKNGNAIVPDGTNIQGMVVSKLTPGIREKFKVKTNSGVIVTDVKPRTISHRHGVKKGDIILSVNQIPVNSPEEISDIIKEAKKQKRTSVVLLIVRSDFNIFLQLPI